MREKGEDLSLLTVACPRWVGDMHSDNSCSHTWETRRAEWNPREPISFTQRYLRHVLCVCDDEVGLTGVSLIFFFLRGK